MALLTRLYSTEIKAGLQGSAGHVNAELNQLIAGHNSHDGRLDALDDAVTGTVPDHETRITDNETDIVTLRNGGGALEVSAAAYTLGIPDSSYTTIMCTGAADQTITLPDPLGLYANGRYFMISHASASGIRVRVQCANAFCMDRYSTSNLEVVLLHGEVALCHVVDYAVGGGTPGWTVQKFRNAGDDCAVAAAIGAFVIPDDVPVRSVFSSTAVSVTLPSLNSGAERGLLGLEIAICASNTITVAATAGDLIDGAASLAGITGNHVFKVVPRDSLPVPDGVVEWTQLTR